ncbi:MAG: DUF1820 family protein [Desulfuromonadales bacterium]|nr:DUF1820 family protein [Desulfuromonadales bacterium]
MSKKTVYRIYFSSQGKSYELYARKVEQAELYGFVCVGELLFGERSSVLLDPGEESLKNEFKGVKRLLIPFQQIARIDEVDKEGRGKVMSLPGGVEPVAHLPIPPKQN